MTCDDEIYIGDVLLKNNSSESVYYYKEFSTKELTLDDISKSRLDNQLLSAGEEKNGHCMKISLIITVNCMFIFSKKLH